MGSWLDVDAGLNSENDNDKHLFAAKPNEAFRADELERRDVGGNGRCLREGDGGS